mmetsp:Transcript_18307/g.25201  ORF Transcript_18307/g.25201 Transcript_18307/m.25201 type:complete len:188 (+) Transcript_18307:54-617(+)
MTRRCDDCAENEAERGLPFCLGAAALSVWNAAPAELRRGSFFLVLTSSSDASPEAVPVIRTLPAAAPELKLELDSLLVPSPAQVAPLLPSLNMPFLFIVLYPGQDEEKQLLFLSTTPPFTSPTHIHSVALFRQQRTLAALHSQHTHSRQRSYVITTEASLSLVFTFVSLGLPASAVPFLLLAVFCVG